MDTYEAAVAIWKQREIANGAQLAEALNGHSIAFAYHSGKMENARITYHDTREIFDHDGVTSYTGDLRTLFEIRNAKDANELFLSAFQNKRPVDETLVREFHRQREDRRAYFDALESWDRSQELEPMIAFLKEQTAKTWKKQVERAAGK